MKLSPRYFLAGLLGLLAFTLLAPLTAVGQAVVDSVVVAVPVDPFPGVTIEQTLALVSFLTPIVTWLAKLAAGWMKKTMPSWAVAGLATVIGLIMTYFVALEANTSLAWYIYLLVATGGIGLRQLAKHLVVQPVKALGGK